MTDQQLLTLGLSIVIPVSMLIYSNSRISDVRKSIDDAKETLRAEMATLRSEINLAFQRIENKLDHVIETQARHSERLEGLEKGR